MTLFGKEASYAQAIRFRSRRFWDQWLSSGFLRLAQTVTALDHREISMSKPVEVGAVTVWAGEEIQRIATGPRNAAI